MAEGMRWTWKRLLSLAAGGPILLSTVCISYAWFGTDHFFSGHWCYAEPVMMARTHSWALWQHSLSASERVCLHAWLDAMRLKKPSDVKFSPMFVLQDTLCFVCGRREWCDAVALLAKIPFLYTTPYCMEIRREQQGDVVFLHGKLETELSLHLPFNKKTPQIVFPSIVTLQLEKTPHCSYVITAAEHRWFGGPIISQQSASLRTPWGDLGDLSRRFLFFSVLCAARAQERIGKCFQGG